MILIYYILSTVITNKSLGVVKLRLQPVNNQQLQVHPFFAV